MSFVSRVALRRRVASHPSSFGRLRSIEIRSGRSAAAMARLSSPKSRPAVKWWKPSTTDKVRTPR